MLLITIQRTGSELDQLISVLEASISRLPKDTPLQDYYRLKDLLDDLRSAQ
jgi:hypothetical protein